MHMLLCCRTSWRSRCLKAARAGRQRACCPPRVQVAIPLRLAKSLQCEKFKSSYRNVLHKPIRIWQDGLTQAWAVNSQLPARASSTAQSSPPGANLPQKNSSSQPGHPSRTLLQDLVQAGPTAAPQACSHRSSRPTGTQRHIPCLCTSAVLHPVGQNLSVFASPRLFVSIPKGVSWADKAVLSPHSRVFSD